LDPENIFFLWGMCCDTSASPKLFAKISAMGKKSSSAQIRVPWFKQLMNLEV
jgi:hypothetical protein